MDGFGGPALSTLSSPSARMESLQSQLSYLRWRRTMVDRSIRRMVDDERALNEKDALMRLSVNEAMERQAMAQEVVADELCKPLEVSKEFVARLEAEEAREREAERLTAKRHLKSIKKLKKKAEGARSPNLDDRLRNLELRVRDQALAS